MKKFIFGVIGILLIVITVLGYRNINKLFPENKITKVPMGSQIEYQEDIYISVLEKEVLSKKESEELYEETMYNVPFESRVLKVVLELENRGEEKREVLVSDLNMESKGMGNGVSPEYTGILGGEETIRVELEPGERKQKIIGYDILSNQINKKEWKEIEERKFYLTFALYPEKKMLELEEGGAVYETDFENGIE